MELVETRANFMLSNNCTVLAFLKEQKADAYFNSATGHTRFLTVLVARRNKHQCAHNAAVSVHHILSECSNFNSQRLRFNYYMVHSPPGELPSLGECRCPNPRHQGSFLPLSCTSLIFVLLSLNSSRPSEQLRELLKLSLSLCCCSPVPHGQQNPDMLAVCTP
ncbi:hypothetical protein AVEN_79285-1 [Araneus ventricosus]|uniref:Uncharacterized protein n=1 Tax=Araneus ventricosus TaxID=182803 RepID=A0A4Y2WRM3_ARAVE|nr:hypothetical protein AVEN_79285-1 [Araneus ventricosus]